MDGRVFGKCEGERKKEGGKTVSVRWFYDVIDFILGGEFVDDCGVFILRCGWF